MQGIHMHSLHKLFLLPAALFILSGVIQAQPYPAGPVRIVVPYPPGASNDVLGRHLAQKLGPALGQNVIVENRAGASGAIGADHVAKSAANGHTLMFTSSSFATNAAAGIKMPFDPEKAFAPVGLFGISPILLLIHPALPVKSAGELIALAKARPGQINFSSSGNGSINHLSGEYFKNAAKIDIVHVPYKGMVPALTDLVSGQVQIVFTTFSSMGPLSSSGRVRLLAVASAKRSPFAPDKPTVAESGLPGYEAEIWWGLFAPATTPRPIVERLNREMRTALQTADIREKLGREGADATLTTPDEFSGMLQSSIVKWRKVIKDGGIKFD
jgi:tripartite-type tricarboxylate transporter receptor subunit TctC